MRKPTALDAVLLALALACTVFMIWLWREEPGSDDTSARPKSPASAKQVATTPSGPAQSKIERSPISGDLRAMLTALADALIRGDARPREAVLGFKDEASMRRFLERAQKAGLIVLGQVPALHAVRVRFDS